MKYDPEYDSYRFCTVDMDTIIMALTFFSTYSPINDGQRVYIKGLIKDLQNSFAPQDQ